MSGILESGYYTPKNLKRVTVWPAPDVNGDGAEVFQDKYDPVGGEFLGRDIVLDSQTGQPLRHYNPPKGFTEIHTREPGADRATGSFVRTDNRGMPVRNPKTGEAIGIREGSALVEHADGTFELLMSDFAKVLFARAHDALQDPKASLPTPTPENVTPGRVTAPPASTEAAPAPAASAAPASPAPPAEKPSDWEEYLKWKAGNVPADTAVFDSPLPPAQEAPLPRQTAPDVPKPDTSPISPAPLPWDSPGSWGGSPS